MMSKGWKIGLSILAAFMLLLVIGGGACVYILSQYGREIGENAKTSQTEGEDFGRSSDEAGCLKEALSRNKKNSSITNIVSINVFLATCLRESGPTPGFCDGVPQREDKQQSKSWAAQKCAEIGQSGLTCEAMFQVVQVHCETSNNPNKRAPQPEKGKELRQW